MFKFVAACSLKEFMLLISYIELCFKILFISFQDEIHVEENVPWGEDTLFTLEFREEANKYSIHTCNNMYLQRDGKLVPAVNKVSV